jgi:hypothetical protein
MTVQGSRNEAPPFGGAWLDGAQTPLAVVRDAARDKHIVLPLTPRLQTASLGGLSVDGCNVSADSWKPRLGDSASGSPRVQVRGALTSKQLTTRQAPYGHGSRSFPASVGTGRVRTPPPGISL